MSITSKNNTKQSFLKNNRGVAIIEMAVLLPIMLAVVFATIEFGYYFVKSAIAQRAAGLAAAYVQTAYPNSSGDAATINGHVQSIVQSTGLGMFKNLKICGSTISGVQSAPCGNNPRVARANAGVLPQEEYPVQILVWDTYVPVTGKTFTSLTGVTLPQYITASANIIVPPETPNAPPNSCKADEKVVYDDGAQNRYKCVPVYNGQCPPNTPDGIANPQNYSLQYVNDANGIGRFRCDRVVIPVCPPAAVVDPVEQRKYALQYNGTNFRCQKVNSSPRRSFYRVSSTTASASEAIGVHHFCALTDFRYGQADYEQNATMNCQLLDAGGGNFILQLNADKQYTGVSASCAARCLDF